MRSDKPFGIHLRRDEFIYFVKKSLNIGGNFDFKNLKKINLRISQ